MESLCAVILRIPDHAREIWEVTFAEIAGNPRLWELRR